MIRKTKIVSMSLPVDDYERLQRITKQTNKTRSELLREMLVKMEVDGDWEKIYSWGRKTAKQFAIKSEADVMRILND